MPNRAEFLYSRSDVTNGFGAETADTWASSDTSSALLTDPSAPVVADPEPTPEPAPLPPPMPAAPAPSARTTAGIAILLAGAGATAGFVFGGAWGAGAGLLFMGAAQNGYRAKTGWSSADPSVRADAAKSATMALLGAALGGYLAYRAYQGKARRRHSGVTEVE